MCVSILATDLSSAYNLCCHALMKEKCCLLSMGPEGLKWLNSFLYNRYQYVQMGGAQSLPEKSGNYGVIQGSPSSGELLNYFINDLPDQVKRVAKNKSLQDPQDSSSDGFVDDLSVITQGRNQEELMMRVKEDYSKIEDYLINNKMVINSAKTQLMVMKSKNIDKDVTFNIRQDKMKNHPNMKILGVTLAADSTFDDHLWKGEKNMVKTLNAKINHIKTVKPFLTTKAMANVGSSMMNSTILYAAAVWGGTTQQNINKIQAVKTRGVRMITKTVGSEIRSKSTDRSCLTKLANCKTNNQ